MLKAIVDCDVLVYQSAFGAQKTRYDVTLPNSTSTLTFENAKDRDDYLQAEGLTKEEVTIEPWTDLLPEAAAISIAKNNLDFILSELQTEKYQLFLTGDGNYREQIAVTKPYKGNRIQEKPVYYQIVKDYYIGRGAIVVHGMEADDMLGILATKDQNNVICTIDKDLNQVEGLHYDWNLVKKYKVRKSDGDRFFIMQLLSGDATDNIVGLPKYGMKKAQKLAEECGDNEVFFQKALDLYYKKGYNNEYIEEQGRLLWIKRTETEPLWTIEGFNKHLKGE